MTTTILETDRLILIPLSLEHAPALHQFWSDDAVTAYMSIESFETLKQTQEMITLLVNLMAEEQATRYTIQLKETKEIIGTCGLNYLDKENSRTEIAYELGAAYWRQGYGTELLTKLVEWLFDQQNFHRLEAKIDPKNSASINLIEKLGFQREGLLQDYEKIGDTFFSLLMYARIAK